ncbi:uncharacterized protein MELLADRAFT_85368 [Melampsora larici-populina 98AG31]|uniref:Uncharacterized protein n=1 Tax=Melampsora larici-populina (strain 98AG31 / pathotype 3-4-7) TaxID=747676 RepID=F4SD53_MELLP|nr:uncharacterized protein MELLADRAFT_85368 [Melampsora larici-populina 98AG31]EGF97427.1 hypothetical protein MELLADRAFT_85368 [Melampsora larici-populina 98AG31]
MKHSKLQTHVMRVRAAIENSSRAQNAVPIPGLGSRSSSTVEHDTPSAITVPDAMAIDQALDEANVDVLDEDFADDMTRSDDLQSLYDPSQSPGLGLPPSRQSSVDLDRFLEAEGSDSEISAAPGPEDEPTSAIDAWLPWYPLRKKEHVAALLLLGTGRNLLSTAQYKRIRCILKKVLNVDLPDLGHIKYIRTELKERLGLRVLDRISPHGNPCFTLSVTDIISQELSNPESAPHIEFIPENDQGVTIDRYSQSKKWREDLPRNLRVPMVNVYGEHFYIYEPCQLEDSRVVVPIFFYKKNSIIHAKCLEVVPTCQGSHDFIIPAEPQFDSDTYLDMNVEKFARSFMQIELWNGLKCVF